LASRPRRSQMMNWDGGTAHMSGTGWLLMTLLAVVLLALLTAVVYVMVRHADRRP
jgi:uncharacterized membrane protein